MCLRVRKPYFLAYYDWKKLLSSVMAQAPPELACTARCSNYWVTCTCRCAAGLCPDFSSQDHRPSPHEYMAPTPMFPFLLARCHCSQAHPVRGRASMFESPESWRVPFLPSHKQQWANKPAPWSHRHTLLCAAIMEEATNSWLYTGQVFTTLFHGPILDITLRQACPLM